MNLAFSPFALGGLSLKNRIVMAPMQQYQGTADAMATAYHEQHYARRARGGVAMVIIESTAVAAAGRLLNDDIGIYTPAHVPPLRRIANAIRAEGVPAIIQLCHGGRKSTPMPGTGLLAPSAIAYHRDAPVPTEMSQTDIEEAIAQFALAARRSVEAGFDGIEIHAAHGFLLHQFLSPLSNQRTDAWGGSASKRLRFVAEVLRAVRAEVGASYPLLIRVSATDYAEGGLMPQDVAQALVELAPFGLAAVHVSSGGLLPVAPSQVHPGYQVPFAKTIKDAVNVPVIAVGMIKSRALIEQILHSGDADLVAIGRPLLIYPDVERSL